ncbi:MAG TPA: GNAT family N-acetyltransferase [archaeon]|nr:GNAT family N-acetyltransferase [archaeon]
MEIRIADKNDAKPIVEIIKKHHEEDYMGYVTFDESYIKGKINKNNFFLVAEENDIIVGCVRASLVEMDLAEIRNMCVYKEYRGKGVAKHLLEFALNLLKEKLMRKVVARVKADNISAITVFKSAGFEQEGYFKEHYRSGIDIVQLYKFVK